jgi:hypothetical protein
MRCQKWILAVARLTFLSAPALATGVCSSGCAFVLKTRVDDLELSSLSVRQERVASLGAEPSTKSVEIHATERLKYDPPPTLESVPNAPSPELIVTLKSRRDLAYIAVKRDYLYISAKATFCGTNDEVFGGLSLMEDDLPVPRAPLYDEAKQRYLADRETGDGIHVHVYRVAFKSRWNRGFKLGAWQGQYDLAEDARDLCLRLAAMPYMGVGIGLTSREIVIPNELVKQALAGKAVGLSEIKAHER